MTGPQPDPAHNGVRDECTVLFSGGSDSTLAAVRMLERFSRVHLLTFRRRHLWFVDNAGAHVLRLQQRFGPDRVRHTYLDCTPEFARIFCAPFKQDVKEFGTHLGLLVCLACKLAMHTRTIIYNLERGVPCSAVGSRHESRLYPAQMRSVKARIERMYAEYGMEVVSPVYEMVNTDEAAYELGLSPSKRLKQQFILYDTQPSCLYGGVAYIYSRFFYGPLFGEDAREADSLRYFENKRALVHAIVHEHFESRNRDLSAAVAALNSCGATSSR